MRAAARVSLSRSLSGKSRGVNEIKPNWEGIGLKQNPTKILAETSKVSCFAMLLLCAGSVQAGEPKYKVDASTFQCITKMTPVKHFFVDNLAGKSGGHRRCRQGGKGPIP